MGATVEVALVEGGRDATCATSGVTVIRVQDWDMMVDERAANIMSGSSNKTIANYQKALLANSGFQT